MLGRLDFPIRRSVTQHLRVLSLSWSPPTSDFLLFSFLSFSFYLLLSLGASMLPLLFPISILIVLSTYIRLYSYGDKPQNLQYDDYTHSSNSRVSRFLSCFRSLDSKRSTLRSRKSGFSHFLSVFSFFVSSLTRRTDHPYADDPYRFTRHVFQC